MANQSRIYKLNILADTKGLTDGLDKAKNQVNSSQSGISAAFDKVKLAAIAATAAAGAYAIKLGVDGVKAAIEDTAAQERLANALRNTTQASDAQIRSVEEQILQLSLATGVADDSLRPAFQRLSVATGDLTKSQDLLKLALDISAATGKDVESVTNALGRAYEGSTTSLTRLGVGLSAAQIETLGLEGAISQLSSTFGGAAAVQAETLEGQIQRLKVSFDETKESIGAALLPILTDLFDEFADFAIPAAQKFADVFQKDLIPYLERRVFPAFDDLIESLGGVGDAFRGANPEIEESNILFKTLKDTIVNFVPVTVGALTVVIDIWATFVDIIRRGVAFIQGDLATATAEWNNRFAKTAEVTNNVSDAQVRAYKEFAFWNNQTRTETIPTNDKATESLDRLKSANDRVTSSAREATTALKEQDAWLDRWNKKWGSDPTGAKAVAAARATRTEAEAERLKSGEGLSLADIQSLIQQVYGGIGTQISAGGQLFTSSQVNALIGAGLGGLTVGQLGATVSGMGRASNVTINVNGTVLDPEGTARAVAKVLQDSSGRAGQLVLNPALGFE